MQLRLSVKALIRVGCDIGGEFLLVVHVIHIRRRHGKTYNNKFGQTYSIVRPAVFQSTCVTLFANFWLQRPVVLLVVSCFGEV